MVKIHFASTKDTDMRYAIKARVTDPVLYLKTDDMSYVFLDNREIDVFREENQNEFLEAVLVDRFTAEARENSDDVPFAHKLVYCILRKHGVFGDVIYVSGSFPLDLADYLRGKGAKLHVTRSLFPERELKTQEEEEFVRDSIMRTQKAFVAVEEILRESVIKGSHILFEGEILTTDYIKSVVDAIFLENNLLSVEGMIVSSGAHSSIPHHEGFGQVVPHAPIIVDLFPQDRLTGYFADMTRTYVKGQPTNEFRRMYSTVLEAQEKVIDIIAPGISAKEIYNITSKLILDKGYHVGDKGFVHGVGHGLGLDVHEAPSLGSAGDDVLKIGHIITVEPGLYYSDYGGVRIEDAVVVTKDGCNTLSNHPKKDFIIP